MNKKDLRFASWVISITSILYGMLSLVVMSSRGYNDGYYGWSELYNNGLILIPFILLIMFGIMKICGMLTKKKVLMRSSIVGLMFCWGFVWTSSLMSFIYAGPNRTIITSIPIIAISGFIAMRGDYIE